MWAERQACIWPGVGLKPGATPQKLRRCEEKSPHPARTGWRMRRRGPPFPPGEGKNLKS